MARGVLRYSWYPVEPSAVLLCTVQLIAVAMVMRDESYLTELGLSPVAPIPGLLWPAGTYTPFRLSRALKRDREDT